MLTGQNIAQDPDYFPVVDFDQPGVCAGLLTSTRRPAAVLISAREMPSAGPDTTHVSVMDAMGNAVAYTTTLNLSYGAKMVAAGTASCRTAKWMIFPPKKRTPIFDCWAGK